ncbi:adenylate kinase [Granulicella aggregans]|uniref:Adenylate kinase n=1 Tax=Granulicella aggregans TaxID=474949 RepID=A0A7W8E2E0_9BACT|nr:adenylate kinase [Granulicella aggregans]MBB5056089.1 adenylate kinase [Granulicella aggregans]
MTDSIQRTPASAEDFLPGPVLLLGAPGVGKGTQAQILMAEYGIPQISTGEILRKNIADGTELGLKAKGLMDQGLFVDDETVNGMVAARLHEPGAERGFILDGYPRTLAQAGFIDGLLEVHQVSGQMTLRLLAVSLKVDEQELLKRITGRRICPACKRSYNVYSEPPLVAGICDVEGSELVQRPDDTEETFRERMVEYNAKTAHVIEHYRGQGCFAEVDGARPVAEVTASVVAALKSLRAAEVVGKG